MTDYMKALRERRAAEGLKAVTVWTYPENREKLMRYIERLNQRTRPGTPHTEKQEGTR